MRISDSTNYTLRRLHSLTGVVPIGAFLLEHFFTNSRAIQGEAAFNRAAADLASLPYVVLLEAFGIWLPILFHMVLGVVIATTAQARAFGPGGAPRFQYVLQRLTGIFLVVFIVYHTWSTRFSHEAMSAPSLFAYMAKHLENPGVFWFYALGAVTACFHFGNGLFGFSIHWGLATGRNAQRWASRLGFAVFLALALVSLNSLFAFVGKGVPWFEKVHTPQSATNVEAAR